MNKIEKIRTEIERRIHSIENWPFIEAEFGASTRRDGKLIVFVYKDLLSFINSLQQEQTEPVKGKFVFPKFLYARTLDNKTIDVSYVPQSMDAIEYVQNSIEEQPEVDLEKEYTEFVEADPVYSKLVNGIVGKAIARHFYELGLNARKEESK